MNWNSLQDDLLDQLYTRMAQDMRPEANMSAEALATAAIDKARLQ